MIEDDNREVDMVGWVAKALEARAARQRSGQPISSSAPEVQEAASKGGPLAAAASLAASAAGTTGKDSTATVNQPVINGNAMPAEANPVAPVASEEVPAATEQA
jgi:hypothetical protein